MVEQETKLSIDLGRPVFQPFQIGTPDSSGYGGGYLALDTKGDIAIFLSRILGVVALENVSYAKSPVVSVREAKIPDHRPSYTYKEVEGFFGPVRVCPHCSVQVMTNPCNFTGGVQRYSETTSELVTLTIKLPRGTRPKSDHSPYYYMRLIYDSDTYQRRGQENYCGICDKSAVSCTFKGGEETAYMVVKISFKKRVAINEQPPAEILAERAVIEISGQKEEVEKLTSNPDFGKVVAELKARPKNDLVETRKTAVNVDGSRRGPSGWTARYNTDDDPKRRVSPPKPEIQPFDLMLAARRGEVALSSHRHGEDGRLPRANRGPFNPSRPVQGSSGSSYSPPKRRY